jgi:hypothetical protein
MPPISLPCVLSSVQKQVMPSISQLILKLECKLKPKWNDYFFQKDSN